jgi:triacylglycerol esterase/lipase EstA (alpha/beta hydrolase family)
VEADRLMTERGWRHIRADVHPMRSCEANEADIEAAFHGEGLDALMQPITEPEPPKKVFLLGYSKGTPDIMSFIVNHPEYHDRIKGVFTWAGAAGGSYTADREVLRVPQRTAVGDQPGDAEQGGGAPPG